MMLKKTTRLGRLLLMATFGLCLFPACREPLLREVEVDSEIPFDASVGCAEESAKLFNNENSPYFGGEEAQDAVVVQFSNFGCSHCAVFAQDTRKMWERRTDFRKRVRIYFHHFPFSSETNWQQHQAAVAAGNQGMEHFWGLHDYIYDGALEHNYYTTEELRTFAEESLKLDMSRFDADFASEETLQFLQQEIDQAALAGVQGTPTVFLCGQLIRQRSTLEAAIDKILEQVGDGGVATEDANDAP